MRCWFLLRCCFFLIVFFVCSRWDSGGKKHTHIFVLSWYFSLIFPFPLQRRPFDLWWASWLCVFILQILFMNKIDLFQDKILHSGRHLRLYLPQFKGRSRSTRSDRLKTLIAVCIFEIKKNISLRWLSFSWPITVHSDTHTHTHARAPTVISLWDFCARSAFHAPRLVSVGSTGAASSLLSCKCQYKC